MAPPALGKERALGATVALAKRMQLVQLGEQVGEPAQEILERETAQMVALREAIEHLGGVGLEILGTAEHPPAAERDRAQLPGPRVDILEQVPVKVLQMVEIVGAGEAVFAQLDQPQGGELGLDAVKFCLVVDAEQVAQDSAAEVEVRVGYRP